MAERKRRACRRGLSVVEAAVLLPFFLVAALAGLDYCRIMKDEVIISHAAHLGAVAGASQNFTSDTRSDWQTRIRDAVLQSTDDLSNREQHEPQIRVTTVREPGEYFVVTVEVAYPFQPVLLSHFFPAETVVRRSQTMRRFR